MTAELHCTLNPLMSLIPQLLSKLLAEHTIGILFLLDLVVIGLTTCHNSMVAGVQSHFGQGHEGGISSCHSAPSSLPLGLHILVSHYLPFVTCAPCWRESANSRRVRCMHARQAPERQDLSCRYLAHHELESVCTILVIIISLLMLLSLLYI